MCFPRYQGSLSLRRQKGLLSRQQTNHRRIDYISISDDAIRAGGPGRTGEAATGLAAPLSLLNSQKMHFNPEAPPVPHAIAGIPGKTYLKTHYST